MTTKSKRSQPTKRVTTTEPPERGWPWPLLWCIVTASAAFLILSALVLSQRDCPRERELAHLWRAHTREHVECLDAETWTDACEECHR